MAVLLIVTLALTLVVIGIVVAGLIRRVARLNSSLTGIQRDLVPALDEIQAGATEAQERAARVQERATALAPGDR